MTYFPIPGEGAWVLLREFCQKQVKHYYAQFTQLQTPLIKITI